MAFESRRTVDMTSGAKEHEEGERHPPRIRQQWAAVHRDRANELALPAPEAWRPEHPKLLLEQRQRRANLAAREGRGTSVKVLTCWREMPDLPKDYSVLLGERPFDGPPPRETHEVNDEVAFRKAVDAQVHKERRGGKWKRILLSFLLFPCVVGLIGASLQPLVGDWSTLGALAGYVGFVWLCTGPWRRGTQRLAEQRFREQWPAYWREALAVHSEHAAWPEQERERVAWTRRVVAGEPEAVMDSVQRELEALELPFESRCDFRFEDAEHALIVLDLPEIDDVVDELVQHMKWDGTMEEKGRRTRVERNEEYLRLVVGLGMLVTRTVFMAAPTLRQVKLAAYTQRRKSGSGILESEFVYEVVFSREDATWDPKSVEPIYVLDAPANRFYLGPDKKLTRIDPPSWWATLSQA
ncbi:hypothetical protein JY651_51385 [Pyxidicoccus parkwayensis]|uniref:Uncharacterized protein n=1 Tax=Pyxidicoccus parkwayensis TaxID=2813578 RepID=A0ABX7NXD4_9BACT|nr:hypothetical protein [Pyxidicoccus parkwaysis]QSQ23388.1 hypothetical protein JY651_51385 [Pyxidicoccus parkwaysis]